MRTQRRLRVLMALLFVLLGCGVAFLYPAGDETFWFYHLSVALGIVSLSLTVFFNRRLFALRLRTALGEYRREWKRTRSAWLVVVGIVGMVLAVWAISVLVTV